MSRRSTDEEGHASRSASRGADGDSGRGSRWLTRGVIVLAVCVCGAGALVVAGVLAVFGVVLTTVSNDVDHQCRSAGVVLDPSASATPEPAPRGTSGEPAKASTLPTENPYAAMESDDGEPPGLQVCSTAMKHAPYQGAPVHAVNDSAAAECAARLAGGQVGRWLPQASLVRVVIFGASASRCEAPPSRKANTNDAVELALDLPPATTCPDPGGLMLMPDTVAAQGFCGQIVDPTAVGYGDLVFSRGESGATRVGIAIGPTQLVTADSTTGQVVQERIPETDDVVVKRVLPVA